MMRSRFSITVCTATVCLGLLIEAHARPNYMARVPVTGVACDTCHINSFGGPGWNQFGLDFLSQGLNWSATLCTTDSDGDGFTNGEELGFGCCETDANGAFITIDGGMWSGSGDSLPSGQSSAGDSSSVPSDDARCAPASADDDGDDASEDSDEDDEDAASGGSSLEVAGGTPAGDADDTSTTDSDDSTTVDESDDSDSADETSTDEADTSIEDRVANNDDSDSSTPGAGDGTPPAVDEAATSTDTDIAASAFAGSDDSADDAPDGSSSSDGGCHIGTVGRSDTPVGVVSLLCGLLALRLRRRS